LIFLQTPEKFDKHITALRTAVDNDGTLDKEERSYNDIFDAFRLALKFYHFDESRYTKLGMLPAYIPQNEYACK
jgi:hypothetical protein